MVRNACTCTYMCIVCLSLLSPFSFFFPPSPSLSIFVFFLFLLPPTPSLPLSLLSLPLSLGSSLDTLIVLGSSNGDIILQANTQALVRLTLHSSSTQQLSMSLSSVFSIEPNMESFQYDESLPQYVGKVNDVVCKWPLLFTLTEDGIVRIL